MLYPSVVSVIYSYMETRQYTAAWIYHVNHCRFGSSSARRIALDPAQCVCVCVWYRRFYDILNSNEWNKFRVCVNPLCCKENSSTLWRIIWPSASFIRHFIRKIFSLPDKPCLWLRRVSSHVPRVEKTFSWTMLLIIPQQKVTGFSGDSQRLRNISL